MKILSTVVKDVYAYVSKKPNDGGPALRMSSLGEKCMRKLWYKERQPEKAEPLFGHTLMNFENGHLLEDYVLDMVAKAGHTVEGRQDEVELYGVKGHIDAIIDGVLVDVKSANSRSIEKFKEHRLESDDPFGYLTQLFGYLDALQGDPRLKVKGSAAFLAVDKELGHLYLDIYRRPEGLDFKEKIDGIREALTKDEPPPRAYKDEADGRSGNRQLSLACRYCQYKTTCWADANSGAGLRKFIYSFGPRWLTHVEREPNVHEEQRTVLGSKVEQEPKTESK